MSGRTLIMCENTPVLAFDFEELYVEILNEGLVPYQLRGALREMPVFTTESVRYQATQLAIVNRHNEQAIISWLAQRTLLLSRKNAKWLYNLIKASQSQDEYNRARIALRCRAVSVLDNYWVKTEGDEITWDLVNIRHVHLNDIITQVALHARSLSLQGSLQTPEFSTNGVYAKGWRRYPDGRLWLHKLGASGDFESKVEVMCSNLLDKMNVDHVHYEEAVDEGAFVCACPSMTSDNLSIISGEDFVSYCQRNNKDPDKEMYALDGENLYKMHIVDYLISNRDRHGQNWGFYYDASTLRLLGCHPLFDHNNAFDIDTMNNKDAGYIFTDKDISIRDAARHAMQKVDFYFTDEITRKDFLTDRQHASFMSRAKELGVRTEKSIKQ